MPPCLGSPASATVPAASTKTPAAANARTFRMLPSLTIARLGPRRLRRTIAMAEGAGNGQRTVKALIRIDNSDEWGGECGTAWHDAQGARLRRHWRIAAGSGLREIQGSARIRKPIVRMYVSIYTKLESPCGEQHAFPRTRR